MKYYTLAICLLYCCLSFSNPIKNINVQRINIEDGLSQYTINSIYQDEFGFIWIATLDGLNRYDGTRIDVFRPSKTDSLSIQENNIRDICGDNNGHLYIKGIESVYEYDMRTNTFRMILRSGVRAMCYRNGVLWLAIGESVYSYDTTTKEIKKRLTFPERGQKVVISSLGATESGELYLSTVFHGFYRISPSMEVIQHIDMAEANSLYYDSKGNIWVASRSEGLYCISHSGAVKRYSKTGTKQNELINNNVRHICEDEHGNFYAGTYDGLCYLDIETGDFTEYKYDFQRTSRSNRSILTMMRDRQGTLWIGTFYEGLQTYNTTNDIYRSYAVSTNGDDRLSSPIVSAMVEDRSGILWLATEGGGLNSYDHRTSKFKSMRTQDGLTSNVLKSLCYEADDNTLWVASLYDGINKINLSTGAITKIHNHVFYNGDDIGYAHNTVKMVPIGDSMLLATNKGVVMMDKRTHRMTKLDVGVVAPRRSQIWDICIDDNTMWLTSTTDLFRVDLSTKTSRRYTFKDISGSHVGSHLNCILKDSKGRMWFGSSGSGLFLYDRSRDKFVNYDSSHGLSNNFVTSIVERHDGSGFYIATNSGFSFFDPEKELFINYAQELGLPMMSVNENGLYMTSYREIFVSGHNGLISVADSNLKLIPRDSRVYITDIYVNNSIVHPEAKQKGILIQSTLYQNEIVLQPKHSVISFAFTDTDFRNSKKTPLEYMLRGFDKHFIAASESHVATYTNLSPGKYTFIVRSAGSNDFSTFMKVVVLPPFYKTVWFVLICVAFFLSTAIFLIRTYVQGVVLRTSLESERKDKVRIEEVTQSKLRFFTNISHEFRTPLTLIDAQLELMLKRNDIKPTVYTSLLSVYKNSRRMRRLVDEVIDIRRQEQGFLKLKVCRQNIVDFTKEVYLSFEDFAKHKNITYTFTSQQDSCDVVFDTTQMEKVIFNLLSNAFKYTAEGGNISVSINEVSDDVHITVCDNGRGVAPEHLAFVFKRFYQDDVLNDHIPTKGSGVGLALSKGIVDMHGGAISVTSIPDKQTCFTVILHKELDMTNPLIEQVEWQSNRRYISDPENCEHIIATDDEQTTEQEGAKSEKLLIVEDNEEIRNTLVQIFSPIYETFTAYDGQSGIEVAREQMPDLILSDIMMPRMSGSQMCRLLKSDFATCHIPIVLLTARGAEEHKIEGLTTGADDYITKPFSVKLLVARCSNLIAGRRRLQQKYMREPELSVDVLSTNSLDGELLRKAIEVVERNIDNSQFDIHQFSQEIGMSRTALFRKIKGLTGQTPNEFVASIRLKKAVVLFMSNPSVSISETAYDLGFNSVSYFIKCFKDMYGKSPRAYLKERMKE